MVGIKKYSDFIKEQKTEKSSVQTIIPKTEVKTDGVISNPTVTRVPQKPIIKEAQKPVLEQTTETKKDNLFYGKTAVFPKDKILSKDAIALFEKKGILKDKLHYIINHIGDNITIYKYNENADKMLKDLVSSLIGYLNEKKVITGNYKIEGDEKSVAIKGIAESNTAEIIKGSLIKILNS